MEPHPPSAASRTFPPTRWTTVRGAGSSNTVTRRASIETLVRLYEQPIRAYFRHRWRSSAAEADELAQEFFEKLVRTDVLARLSPTHGRFRAYVKVVLDNFLRMRRRSAARQARREELAREGRGGTVRFADRETPERILLREWGRSVLQGALAELRQEYTVRGKERLFELFLQHDVEPPVDADVSHAALAARFGISTSQVNNALYRARLRLRELILERLRDTVSTEDEVVAEMRELFGGE